MEREVVYLNITKNVEVTKKKVTVKDLTKVYCKNEKLTTKIENLPILTLQAKEGDKETVTILYIIKKINDALDEPIIITNMGESDCIINFKKSQPEKKWITNLKVTFIVLVTFIGSVFAIMTYNEDVSAATIFDKIHLVFTGEARNGAGMLEIGYSVGVAGGIIVFFNHFGKKKLTQDPTPMEIEMEKYEEDICDTIVKESARKDMTKDVP